MLLAAAVDFMGTPESNAGIRRNVHTVAIVLMTGSGALTPSCYCFSQSAAVT